MATFAGRKGNKLHTLTEQFTLHLQFLGVTHTFRRWCGCSFSQISQLWQLTCQYYEKKLCLWKILTSWRH